MCLCVCLYVRVCVFACVWVHGCVVCMLFVLRAWLALCVVGVVCCVCLRVVCVA